MHQVKVIDSHTGGEPTRVVISGGPELGNDSLIQRRARFRDQFDRYRSAIVNEPRGSDVWVGALLCEPVDRECDFGVIFFNNASYLGMCGHGTIGLIKTLAYLERIQPGTYRLETPVGRVTATLLADGRVAVQNVPSYRTQHDVTLRVEGVGKVVGDVAWGGNWFFLVKNLELPLSIGNVEMLTGVTHHIRFALTSAGITGDDGAEIDHIELYGPPEDEQNDSRNFVLCPGGAYDRSPCGTGTSAKLSCLAADGKLAPGKVWRQESVIGSVFEASYAWDETDDQQQRVIPTITGHAAIMAEATLLMDDDDAFAWGIR